MSATTASRGPTPTFDYRPAPPELVERIRRIDAVCASFGVPLRAVPEELWARLGADGLVP